MRVLKNEGPLAAVKWVLLNPDISTTVPYAKNRAEVEMNFRAMTEPYTPQDEKMLFARNEEIRPLYCRMCYECKGKCPNGIPVTDELRYLAYNDFAGDFRQARGNFMHLPQEIRNVQCSDCSSCAIRVPQWGRSPKQADQGARPSGIESRIVDCGLRNTSAIRNPI